MPDETLTSAPPSVPKPRWVTWRRFVFGLTLSRFQATVGTMAAVCSVTGAAFSLVQFARPAKTGELVAVVQAAGSRRSVSDATIEIVTTENAIVATLTPDSRGRATKDLPEGVYTVRVSHPRYEADVHRIHVLPRETVEIRASLRAGSSSPIQRVLNSGASAFRRALRF